MLLSATVNDAVEHRCMYVVWQCLFTVDPVSDYQSTVGISVGTVSPGLKINISDQQITTDQQIMRDILDELVSSSFMTLVMICIH